MPQIGPQSFLLSHWKEAVFGKRNGTRFQKRWNARVAQSIHASTRHCPVLRAGCQDCKRLIEKSCLYQAYITVCLLLSMTGILLSKYNVTPICILLDIKLETKSLFATKVLLVPSLPACTCRQSPLIPLPFLPPAGPRTPIWSTSLRRMASRWSPPP